MLKKLKNYFLISIVFSLLFGMNVYASEINSGIDSETDSRLNSMEQRLSELGSSMEDIQTRLSMTEEQLIAEEQFRLSISQQLDILLVGINEWYNNYVTNTELDIEYKRQMTEKYNELLSTLVFMDKKLSFINDGVNQISLLTVSGNTIASETNDILNHKLGLSNEELVDELNGTLTVTNTYLNYLFCFLLFFLIALVFYFLIKYIWHNLIKHIFYRMR